MFLFPGGPLQETGGRCQIPWNHSKKSGWQSSEKRTESFRYQSQEMNKVEWEERLTFLYYILYFHYCVRVMNRIRFIKLIRWVAGIENFTFSAFTPRFVLKTNSLMEVYLPWPLGFRTKDWLSFSMNTYYLLLSIKNIYKIHLPNIYMHYLR